MRFALLLAVTIASITACTLLDDDPPDDSCRDSGDCFRAQGEVCNPDTKRCEMSTAREDAGVDAP